jgi:hypothetical protein
MLDKYGMVAPPYEQDRRVTWRVGLWCLEGSTERHIQKTMTHLISLVVVDGVGKYRTLMDGYYDSLLRGYIQSNNYI